MRAVWLIAPLLVTSLAPSPALAQAEPVSEPEPEPVSEPEPTPALTLDASLADAAAAMRLAGRGERFDDGVFLLAFGGLSAVTGGVLAGAGYEDTRLVAAGLGTAVWGVTNLLFAFFMMDLDGSRLAQIERDRALRGERLLFSIEDAAQDEHTSAAIIAVNAGLDVFYVVTGLLLWVIGDQMSASDPNAAQWLTGYGPAMAAQGAVLMGYDLVTWIRSAERGGRLLHLPRDHAASE